VVRTVPARSAPLAVQGDRATEERLGFVVVKGARCGLAGSFEELRLLGRIGGDGERLAEENYGPDRAKRRRSVLGSRPRDQPS
jgi:hypothetical protein